MARAKFHTLTEQMFYVLLCLRDERCGIDILDLVPELTGGRVSVGSARFTTARAVPGRGLYPRDAR